MSVTQSSSSTSSSLIDRAREQDPEAWQRLSDLYGPIVYHWARQAGLQSSDAADVVQEVFRTVAARIGTFRRDQPDDSFRGWLWGITRNKLKEYFRNRENNPQAEGGTDANERLNKHVESLPEDSSVLEHTHINAEIMQRAMEMLRDEFEETTWQCFWRMALKTEPAPDIARDLGMSAKAVRQAKYRVLRRLRRELQELI